MSPIAKSSFLLAALALTACSTVPTGPSVMVLPGAGKSFDQFRADDIDCRQYANYQMNGASAGSAANDSAVRSAVVGTAVGALAGAAINGGRGAGVGAGTGLLFGSMAGTGAADASARGTQRNYDIAYQQCMYAKGNNIPVSGHFAPQRSRAPAYAPSYSPPPPPPGYGR